MFNKKNKIYAIVDQKTCDEKKIDIFDFTKILVESGVELIQYRNKIEGIKTIQENFEKILKLASLQAELIINDYIKIGSKFQTYVHLGQTDKNSENYIKTGRSTHNISEVVNAIKESPKPEYIGFGGMFQSKTKPEISTSLQDLPRVLQIWKDDVVLIGGITLDNIGKLPREKNIYYAIIGDFFTYGVDNNDIKKRVKELCSKFI